MDVNTVGNSVKLRYVTLQLYLRYDFCNVVFKIKGQLYIASGSETPHKSSIKILPTEALSIQNTEGRQT